MSRKQQHPTDHPQHSKCTTTLPTLLLPAPLTLLEVLFLKEHDLIVADPTNCPYVSSGPEPTLTAPPIC
jgi:hypothetical protein